MTDKGERFKSRVDAMRGLKQSLKTGFEKARDRGDLPGRGNGHKVYFTSEQWEPIHEAITAMRKEEGTMTEAQALEFMAAEWFAGAKQNREESDVE